MYAQRLNKTNASIVLSDDGNKYIINVTTISITTPTMQAEHNRLKKTLEPQLKTTLKLRHPFLMNEEHEY